MAKFTALSGQSLVLFLYNLLTWHSHAFRNFRKPQILIALSGRGGCVGQKILEQFCVGGRFVPYCSTYMLTYTTSNPLLFLVVEIFAETRLLIFRKKKHIRYSKLLFYKWTHIVEGDFFAPIYASFFFAKGTHCTLHKTKGTIAIVTGVTHST